MYKLQSHHTLILQINISNHFYQHLNSLGSTKFGLGLGMILEASQFVHHKFRGYSIQRMQLFYILTVKNIKCMENFIYQTFSRL